MYSYIVVFPYLLPVVTDGFTSFPDEYGSSVFFRVCKQLSYKIVPTVSDVNINMKFPTKFSPIWTSNTHIHPLCWREDFSTQEEEVTNAMLSEVLGSHISTYANTKKWRKPAEFHSFDKIVQQLPLLVLSPKLNKEPFSHPQKMYKKK
ncbi:hypothetical protein H671_21599 [Cricetulus griseus]|nr:hypothetical protein H671_21599 [Cricetulus griseus]